MGPGGILLVVKLTALLLPHPSDALVETLPIITPKCSKLVTGVVLDYNPERGCFASPRQAKNMHTTSALRSAILYSGDHVLHYP